MKSPDTRAALRHAAFHRINRQPRPLTLPPVYVDPEETKTPAGCCNGIAIILLTAAIAWAVIIGLAWMITGWLL